MVGKDIIGGEMGKEGNFGVCMCVGKKGMKGKESSWVWNVGGEHLCTRQCVEYTCAGVVGACWCCGGERGNLGRLYRELVGGVHGARCYVGACAD